MSLWLRLNPDPHIVRSDVSLALSETTRGGQLVESCSSHVSFYQATQLYVFSRPSSLRSSALFMSLDRHASTAASTINHHQSDGMIFVSEGVLLCKSPKFA